MHSMGEPCFGRQQERISVKNNDSACAEVQSRAIHGARDNTQIVKRGARSLDLDETGASYAALTCCSCVAHVPLVRMHIIPILAGQCCLAVCRCCRLGWPNLGWPNSAEIGQPRAHVGRSWAACGRKTPKSGKHWSNIGQMLPKWRDGTNIAAARRGVEEATLR